LRVEGKIDQDRIEAVGYVEHGLQTFPVLARSDGNETCRSALVASWQEREAGNVETNGGAGHLGGGEPSPKDLREGGLAIRPEREADEVHSRERSAPHRVDIGKCIDSRDSAKAVRIVDDRWEEIDGVDESRVVRQAYDAGVERELGTGDRVIAFQAGETAENVCQNSP
jgi:hypothetical protein